MATIGATSASGGTSIMIEGRALSFEPGLPVLLPFDQA